MEPPFADAFQNYSFADQALTSTDLLASNSDPDFMYELQDRDVTHRQSPSIDSSGVGGDGGKDVEGCVDQLMGLSESETVHSSSAFEQWDSYWEDLTRYTRLASCEILGNKEVDFLGLDDLSSPYQDEDVIGQTPTLAQLNSEDSQPVCEALYPPADMSGPPLPGHSRRPLIPGQGFGPGSARPSPSSSSRLSRSFLPDFPETSQKATRPVPSCTETMAKTQTLLSLTQDYGHAQTKPYGRGTKMAAPMDFVRKAKVRSHDGKAGPSTSATLVVVHAAADSGFGSQMIYERAAEGGGKSEVPVDWSASVPPLVEASPAMEGSTSEQVSGEVEAGASGGALDKEATEKSKEEEHNYSLFLTRCRLASRSHDAFSEPGCEMELMDDIKGLTTGVTTRKRGKRRYFWEYSEQLTPSKHERMLKPSEWDRHTLPSNLYQKNGPLHGKYMLKKSRRTDVEDLTPNPRKLLQIGTELRKLNKVISDLTPVSELPLTARPRSRKEKNKLASRACRLKKKAQYEANKVKLWGLGTEYDRLLFVINAIKEEIVARVEDSTPRPTNMADTLEHLIKETLVASPVAGQTSDFVNKILETTGRGDPTGGLVGLRVPTSKI
ncbi:hypothetical protein KUCAC02_003814 [Chaenocephalus aceratus]|uniref:Uncharacterized protein n=1 Tax=Chaenocephalus aceratus TaxID=36190 RepID=A0ACB9WM56_CHAAC|nr:hypothetical protein KUCAC02_003814 [Chaenocephalus aceratus]